MKTKKYIKTCLFLMYAIAHAGEADMSGPQIFFVSKNKEKKAQSTSDQPALPNDELTHSGKPKPRLGKKVVCVSVEEHPKQPSTWTYYPRFWMQYSPLQISAASFTVTRTNQAAVVKQEDTPLTTSPQSESENFSPSAPSPRRGKENSMKALEKLKDHEDEINDLLNNWSDSAKDDKEIDGGIE